MTEGTLKKRSPETDALIQDSLNDSSQYRYPVKYNEKFLQTPFSTESDNKNDFQEATEYVEESMSLQEVEREMIVEALKRHEGKRKLAANDLKISERTLYRKLKEYNLDDL